MLRCREPDGGEGWRSKLQNESSFSPIKRLNAFQLFCESEFEVQAVRTLLAHATRVDAVAVLFPSLS